MMLRLLSALDRDRLAIPGIVLAILLFLSANLFLRNVSTGARLDLTEQGLYTLSDGSQQTLKKLEEPVRIRFYLSRSLLEQAPQFSAFADRVQELLGTFAALSGGKLQIDTIDPEPFSVEEDRAVSFGLQGVPLNNGGARGFFGLAATNSTNDQEVIPFFSPDREALLEYDITRIIHALATPGKPVVSVIDGLGLQGSPTTGWRPLQVQEQLASFFDMVQLGGDIDRIDPKTAVLLVIHPQGLSERTQYAIDQYVLGGGQTMIFVDPRLEAVTRPQPGSPPPDPASSLPKLFAAWGVDFSVDSVVADRGTALEVQTVSNGRPVIARHLAWLGLQSAGLNPAEPSVAQLSNLTLTSVGAFSMKEGATATLTPLLSSTAESALIDTARVADRADITELSRDFKPGNTSLFIAARLSGTLTSAFPDGPPKSEATEADKDQVLPLKTSAKPATVLLVGDVDLLTDRTWIEMQDLMGQRVGVPFADNADFVVNALESLVGADALIGLRSRGQAFRPFDRVRALQASADDRFRATEQELTERLRAAESRLASLKAPENSDGLLSAEQQQEIERFRGEMLETRGRLREVQRALRSDIESLRQDLVLLNVLAVPAMVALIALMVPLWRRRRVPPTRNAAIATAKSR